ncbi:DUF1453 domain-containing protein [Oleiagrimonas sp. C23AA]|uniref:DUF1453 domain-containing protein n=1 Tax=Oleiagrimonas sp. C23AA TaxID=2719047 RepID=UPI00141E7B5E|nr:DUF1453 domain-containing protein [Oleiagrimonas sp. C23AA]NII10890.1 DUF1453 domain-containing protein [Oleiagrimonas sp. C23AA]
MSPHLLVPLIAVPLIVLLLARRLRRFFGRQPIRTRRMRARIIVIVALVVLFGSSALAHPPVLEGLVGGLLAGLALALVGLKLTRFEVGQGGTDCYIPNAWIGGLLSAVVLGRIAYRLVELAPAMDQAQSQQQAMRQITHTPMTMAAFGLIFGYYIAYYGGLLIHHRRLKAQWQAP